MVFLSNPDLLLLTFMGILCMQQNDGFEADNKTTSPLLWCTDKSVSTIPLNFIRQSMPYGPGGKQQMPGSERPRPASKQGENVSFILTEAGVCAWLCLSLLLRCVPWVKIHPQGPQKDPKNHKQGSATAAI